MLPGLVIFYDVVGFPLMSVVLALLFCFSGELCAQERQSVDALPPLEERDFRTRVIRNPDNAEAHFNLGMKYAGANMVPQAAESFRQATLIRPEWAEAHYMLGRMYNLLYRYRDAERALKRAVLLKSNYANAYHKLGLVHINLGQYPEAAEAMKNAILLDPGWAEWLYHLSSPNNTEPELGNRGALREIARVLYPQDPRIAKIVWKRWERLRSIEEIWPKAKALPEREVPTPPALRPQRAYKPY